jgi:hypothetical protein
MARIFNPKSLVGADVVQAAGQALLEQTFSVRIVNRDGVDVPLTEEEMARQDPRCYDVNVKDNRIVFVHIRPWNEFKMPQG